MAEWWEYLVRDAPGMVSNLQGMRKRKKVRARTDPGSAGYAPETADMAGAGGFGQDPREFQTTENMSIAGSDQPGNFATVGGGGPTVGAGGEPIQSGYAKGAAPAGGGKGGGGVSVSAQDAANTALDLYGIAKSASPNEARSAKAAEYGVSAGSLPSAPSTLSRSRQAGRSVGTAALGLIPGLGPVAGPLISGAAGVIGGEAEKGAWDKFTKELEAANPQYKDYADLKNPYDVKESGEEKLARIGGEPGSPLSGATTGAGIGTTIAPGIGTAVGAAIGGLAGAFGGHRKKKRAKKREEEMQKIASQNEDKIRQANALQSVGQSVAEQGQQTPNEFAISELFGPRYA